MPNNPKKRFNYSRKNQPCNQNVSSPAFVWVITEKNCPCPPPSGFAVICMKQNLQTRKFPSSIYHVMSCHVVSIFRLYMNLISCKDEYHQFPSPFFFWIKISRQHVVKWCITWSTIRTSLSRNGNGCTWTTAPFLVMSRPFRQRKLWVAPHEFLITFHFLENHIWLTCFPQASFRFSLCFNLTEREGGFSLQICSISGEKSLYNWTKRAGKMQAKIQGSENRRKKKLWWRQSVRKQFKIQEKQWIRNPWCLESKEKNSEW